MGVQVIGSGGQTVNAVGQSTMAVHASVVRAVGALTAAAGATPLIRAAERSVYADTITLAATDGVIVGNGTVDLPTIASQDEDPQAFLISAVGGAITVVPHEDDEAIFGLDNQLVSEVTVEANTVLTLLRYVGVWRVIDSSAGGSGGSAVASVDGRTGAVTLDDLYDPAGAAQAVADGLGTAAALDAGSADGVAELDSGGKVPSSQLPSYVDDVVEVANFAALPGTGETGLIYVTLDTNLTYRWSGSAYVEISASLSLGETSSTAYRGDRGKTAYDHSQVTTGNPHGTTASDVGADPAGTAAGLVDDLSGVSNQATARTNLGLGSAAVEAASAFATAAQGVDARTPTAHKTSHATGGTDALTASDIGAAAASHTHAAYLPLVAAGASVEDIGAIESNVNTVAATGATETLDLSTYGVFDCTMDQACEFTFSNPAPSGKATIFTLILRGAFTPTLPASIDWAGTAPTYTTPSQYVFTTVDGGTTYLGQQVGAAFA